MSAKLEIDTSLVQELILEQFPHWSHLPVRPVELGGWDNRTFRLGDNMSIRLPSAQKYAAQVQKEQKWLPILAKNLSYRIPKPLAMGKPSKKYPWCWSIYQWIEGENANSPCLENDDLKVIAKDLGLFLKQLHKIEITGGPLPGLHNFWRGAHLSIYDLETRAAIEDLKGLIDQDKAIAVWEKAISSHWNFEPVWVHGDFASGNILVKNKQISAIIDFGCTVIGDPACDLVIAWTFLDSESSKVFKKEVGLDVGTWARARGWSLWKASFELVALEDKNSSEAIKQRQIICDITNEHITENYS